MYELGQPLALTVEGHALRTRALLHRLDQVVVIRHSDLHMAMRRSQCLGLCFVVSRTDMPATKLARDIEAVRNVFS